MIQREQQLLKKPLICSSFQCQVKRLRMEMLEAGRGAPGMTSKSRYMRRQFQRWRRCPYFWTSIRIWVPVSSQVPTCATAVGVYGDMNPKRGVVSPWGILSIVNLGKLKSRLPFGKASLAGLYLGGWECVLSLDSSMELTRNAVYLKSVRILSA